MLALNALSSALSAVSSDAARRRLHLVFHDGQHKNARRERPKPKSHGHKHCRRTIRHGQTANRKNAKEKQCVERTRSKDLERMLVGHELVVQRQPAGDRGFGSSGRGRMGRIRRAVALCGALARLESMHGRGRTDTTWPPRRFALPLLFWRRFGFFEQRLLEEGLGFRTTLLFFATGAAVVCLTPGVVVNLTLSCCCKNCLLSACLSAGGLMIILL